MPKVSVTVTELAKLATRDNVVVCDASVLRKDGELWSTMPGYDNFLTGHIPGAQYADLLTTFSDVTQQTGLPDGLRAFGLPSVEQFTHAARALGVNNDTVIVAYDTVQGQWASRIWWLFTYFGHTQVYVLDGGFSAWVSAQRPVATGTPDTPTEGTFVADVNRNRLATKADVVAVMRGDTDAVLMNVLTPEVFRGEIDSDMPRKGRIPRSINLPYTALVQTDGTLKDDETLTALFAAVGVERTRPIIAYCGAGIGATRNALALYKLGFDVAVYDGSLIDWTSDNTLPVHTGEPV